MSGSLFIIVIAIIIVGVLVFLSMSATGPRRHTFDKEEYQTDFLEIENSLMKEQELTYNASVVEADKLLDKALMELGVSGKTMGERMKHCGGRFSELNSVWYAHKLRNQIAHERGFKVEYTQARHALQTYKQALKDLGAI